MDGLRHHLGDRFLFGIAGRVAIVCLPTRRGCYHLGWVCGLVRAAVCPGSPGDGGVVAAGTGQGFRFTPLSRFGGLWVSGALVPWGRRWERA